MNAIKKIITLLLLHFFCGASGQTEAEKTIYIAVSKEYSTYVKWLKSVNADVKIVNLYKSDTAAANLALDTCHALLLTGGEDIYPGRYGKEADTVRCGRFDLKRDTLEFFLVKKALSAHMPLLGICRGEQLLNVALGGTLYIDIPEDVGTAEKHRGRTGGDTQHDVKVIPGTFLHKVSNTESGTIASNHHQGVEKLAPGLRASALTGDGLTEAIEPEAGTEQQSFLLGVQWHPERSDYQSGLSIPIAEAFIRAALEFKKEK